MITNRKIKNWYRIASQAYNTGVDEERFGRFPADMASNRSAKLCYERGKKDGKDCKNNHCNQWQYSSSYGYGYGVPYDLWSEVLAIEFRAIGGFE